MRAASDPVVLEEITRIVIAKAQRETRFRGRAGRIDSTVIEADIRYPSDAMLALQGTRALACEGRKLTKILKGQAGARHRPLAGGLGQQSVLGRVARGVGGGVTHQVPRSVCEELSWT